MKFAWLTFLNIMINAFETIVDGLIIILTMLKSYHEDETRKHLNIPPRSDDDIDDEYAMFWENRF